MGEGARLVEQMLGKGVGGRCEWKPSIGMSSVEVTCQRRILGRACGQNDLFFVLYQINLLYRLLRTFTDASLRFIYPAFCAFQVKRHSSFFRCSPFITIEVLDLQSCLIPSISRLSLLLRLTLALHLMSSMHSFNVCLKTSRLQDLVTTHLITSHAVTALRVPRSMSFQACYLLFTLLKTTVRAQTTTV